MNSLDSVSEQLAQIGENVNDLQLSAKRIRTTSVLSSAKDRHNIRWDRKRRPRALVRKRVW